MYTRRENVNFKKRRKLKKMGKYIFDAYLYIFDVLTVLPNIIFSFLSDLGLSDKKDR